MLKIVPDLASGNPYKVSFVSFWEIPIVLSGLFIPELVFRLMSLPCLNPWNHPFLLGAQVPLSGGCCSETKIWVLGGLITTGASLLLDALSWQGILLASGCCIGHYRYRHFHHCKKEKDGVARFRSSELCTHVPNPVHLHTVDASPSEWDIVGRWECQKRLLLKGCFPLSLLGPPIAEYKPEASCQWRVNWVCRPWTMFSQSQHWHFGPVFLCFVGCLVMLVVSPHLSPVSPASPVFPYIARCHLGAQWPLIENSLLDQCCKEEYARRVGLELRHSSNNQHPTLLRCPWNVKKGKRN